MHHDEIPPGTLYLLILRALARSGELHGYEIANGSRNRWKRAWCRKKRGRRRAGDSETTSR
jgi:hypothetical protein